MALLDLLRIIFRPPVPFDVAKALRTVVTERNRHD